MFLAFCQRRTDRIQANSYQDIYDLIMDKKEMIDEYFSLKINEDGKVESLPMILKGYAPNLDRLPHLLLCLGTQVSHTCSIQPIS